MSTLGSYLRWQQPSRIGNQCKMLEGEKKGAREREEGQKWTYTTAEPGL